MDRFEKMGKTSLLPQVIFNRAPVLPHESVRNLSIDGSNRVWKKWN